MANPINVFSWMDTPSWIKDKFGNPECGKQSLTIHQLQGDDMTASDTYLLLVASIANSIKGTKLTCKVELHENEFHRLAHFDIA